MDAAIQEKVTAWLAGNYDQATKDEIIRLQNENPTELTDSFYRNLEFGTGGLPGIIGVGANREKQNKPWRTVQRNNFLFAFCPPPTSPSGRRLLTPVFS